MNRPREEGTGPCIWERYITLLETPGILTFSSSTSTPNSLIICILRSIVPDILVAEDPKEPSSYTIVIYLLYSKMTAIACKMLPYLALTLFVSLTWASSNSSSSTGSLLVLPTAPLSSDALQERDFSCKRFENISSQTWERFLSVKREFASLDPIQLLEQLGEYVDVERQTDSQADYGAFYQEILQMDNNLNKTATLFDCDNDEEYDADEQLDDAGLNLQIQHAEDTLKSVKSLPVAKHKSLFDLTLGVYNSTKGLLIEGSDLSSFQESIAILFSPYARRIQANSTELPIEVSRWITAHPEQTIFLFNGNRVTFYPMALVGPLLYAAGAGNLGPRATTMAAAFHQKFVSIPNESRVSYLRSAGVEHGDYPARAPVRKAHVVLEEGPMSMSKSLSPDSWAKRDEKGEIAIFVAFAYFVETFAMDKGEDKGEVMMAVFYVVVWWVEVRSE